MTGWGLGVVLACACASAPAGAQPALSAVHPASTAGPAWSQSGEVQAEVATPNPTARFLRDVGRDYKQFLSTETLLWLRVGLAGSLAIHAADEALADQIRQSDPPPPLEGGQQYGSLGVQVPLAVAWWIVGHAAGSARGAAAGRDLVRGQISAVSWTYALKFPVDRTRPNGDPRSFPSGHASASFATAAVLGQHYGWKLGVPAFAAAGYTAASRVADNKHWASDVMFGALLGVASGRTVTVRLRSTAVTISPWAIPGGGGVLVTAMR